MTDQDVDDLRVHAIDLIRTESDGDRELLALRPQLERDTEWWTQSWAPSLALAYLRSGQEDIAWDLLQTAAAAGFHQHETSLSTIHPYAQGFVVERAGKRGEIPLAEGGWPLDLTPGEHNVQVKLVTGYGEVAAGRISYRVCR
jgi:hypothetical protein